MEECKWLQERKRWRIKKRRAVTKVELPLAILLTEMTTVPWHTINPDHFTSSKPHWQRRNRTKQRMRERKASNAGKSGTTLVWQIQPSFRTQARGDCRLSKDIQRDRRVKKETGDGSSAYVYEKKKIWNRRLFEREMLWSSPHAEIIEANKKIFHKLQGHNVNHTKASWEPVVAYACAFVCACVCVFTCPPSPLLIKCVGSN